MVEENRFYPK